MEKLNTNDYKVLHKIINVEGNKGISKLRGVTVYDIVDSTGFSSTKVRNSLKKLLENKYIDKAVKKVRADAFYITPEGIQQLKEVTKVVEGIVFGDYEDEDSEYQGEQYSEERAVDVEYEEVENKEEK